MRNIVRTVLIALVGLILLAPLGGCRSKIMGGPGIMPKKGEKEYNQAVAAFSAGDEARGLELLQKVTLLNPKHIGARSILGDYYKEKGQYPRAIAEYEVLTVADPKSADAHYRLGLAYQLNDEPEKAVMSYDRAIDIEPAHVSAKINRGTCLIHLGRTLEGMSQLEQATVESPQSAPAFANLAVAYESVGKLPEAEAANRKALELNPDLDSAKLNLVNVLILQSKSAEAITLLSPMVAKSPTPEICKKLGDAYATDKQPQQAIAAYDQAMQLNARYYPAMNAKASALIDQYKSTMRLDDLKRKDAVSLWLKSLEIEADQPTVRDLAKLWENP